MIDRKIELTGLFKGMTIELTPSGVLTLNASEWKNGLNEIELITNIKPENVKITEPTEEKPVSSYSASIKKDVYQFGDVLPDGWIVGPISPTTKKRINIEPVETALNGTVAWKQATEHAKRLLEQGNDSARLPYIEEWPTINQGIVRSELNKTVQFDREGTYWSSNQATHDKMWVTAYDLSKCKFTDIHRFSERLVQARVIRDEPASIYEPD